MSVRDYGLAAPHGPNVHTDQHVATGTLQGQFATHDMSENEESVFRSILKPDDIYDEQGRYWADLPLAQRISFVAKVDGAETRRELNTIGRMIKKDPLSPLGAYTRNMIIPGAGLLLEGYVYDCLLQPKFSDNQNRYVLFSIGNIKPLLQAAFPQCWSKEVTCNYIWVDALDYLEICGIIVGTCKTHM
jgi:hypothetical protein